jgi:hypothetical protein
MKQLGGLLGRYEQAGAANVPDSVDDDFDQAYAQQPQIVKTLGKAALAVALAHMVQKQYSRR